MNFTLSATGSKADALKQLETQRESAPDYESLKNQVIEHVQAKIGATPENSTGFSVSVSCTISYQVAASLVG